MSEDFAHKNNIPLICCLSPLAVEAVDGSPLGSGRITHLTSCLTLVTGALHQEIIQFYIISTLHAPVILGLPWLRKHDPSISWRDSQITGWGSTCFMHCLPQIHPLPIQIVEVTDPTSDIQGLPDVYGKPLSQRPRGTMNTGLCRSAWPIVHLPFNPSSTTSSGICSTDSS